MKTLLVEACEGREVPIHQNDNPTGGAFILRPGDAPAELADSPGVRRRVRAGDLRVCTVAAKPAAKTTSEK